MIQVEEALERVLAGFTELAPETVSLHDALGRVLAKDVKARLTQPPNDVSAMDGFAVKSADIQTVPVTLKIRGEAPAGGSYEAQLQDGEAVRIFTGGPVPLGADCIVIQENTDHDDTNVTVKQSEAPGRYIRPAGLDFSEGQIGLEKGTTLTARDLALAAAMNHPWLEVYRKPKVAILATGNEVVLPGVTPGPNQIISSNTTALMSFVRECGGEPISLGIAPDDKEALSAMAKGAEGADLLLTTGGASVGDHDLVRSVLGEQGLEIDFWRIAMRPGKPLIFGKLGRTPMIGLPGNPVSTLVCAYIFARPALWKMTGRNPDTLQIEKAVLTSDLGENDKRQDYLRARLSTNSSGQLEATPFDRQDSAMLNLLRKADCLVIRAPFAVPAAKGTEVEIIRL
ncbi:molybdenum cofactor biosynthesis protein MoaA [Kiloniella litopenaei]|uniref:Molybdopterin molybdenumtransferase n=1 Tax=Kiloniella litopenaei TaxID=1549748 RepID=A0A0M2R0U0_9PROT|nr:gephyrin-like molybdotransferase Glp [Kiloniella litopenaei]KKJ75512.1 molybdenum cofactor biosynthesis protein MoaA [Kiloniella litopenaei]